MAALRTLIAKCSCISVVDKTCLATIFLNFFVMLIDLIQYRISSSTLLFVIGPVDTDFRCAFETTQPVA